MKNSKFDLNSDNILKTFLIILVPTIVAQIISGTFVVFDTFFVSSGFQPGGVGNGIGESLFNKNAYSSLGPAAISYAFPYTFFIIGLGLLVGGGLASIMTKQLANDDKVGYQRSMNSFAPLTIYFGIAVMIFLLIFAKVLVWFGSGFQTDYLNSWFNNPLMNHNWSNSFDFTDGIKYDEIYNAVNGHILSQASWFLRIQAFGAIPYIYMVGGVIMLRVQGKAQYATAFSSIGLFSNILLDFIFIIVLKMNIVGAAIATVASQFITALIYYWYFSKKANVKSNKMDWKNSNKIIKEVSNSGTSLMMIQLITGLILIIFTFFIGATNYGEMYKITNYTAVYQGYNSLFIFLNLVVVGITQSMTPLVTYNHEKGNVKKVKKARNIGFSYTLVFAIISMIIIITFPKIINLFYSVNGKTADYISTGYLGLNGLLLEGQFVYTNGVDVAQKIVRILFITFPLAMFILVGGTYLQCINENKKSSIILFGKPLIIIPIMIIFGFLFSSVVSSSFYFDVAKISDPTNIISNNIEKANLGLFLSLPITDLIIFIIVTTFIIKTNKDLNIHQNKESKE